MLLSAFAGANNVHIVPAANTYVQIRGLAWPAILIGWVAQSASLGMKDSWGPLKALAVASIINGIGDILLCRVFSYGIAGAAWATMASQVVAGYMMVENLNKKGYNAYALSIPSPKELIAILELAAPVFITMTSKVAFYSLLIYFATSMGTISMAAHQVMIQTFCMCTVWGEPLSQTAQSFMPELIYGVQRNLEKARMLLKSLVLVGAVLGIVLGSIGTAIPWLFPNIFTPDQLVIQEINAPPSQPNTSTRQPWWRPRGSRTMRHGEAPRGDNHGNPTNPQDEQLGNTRDILVDEGDPKNPRNTDNREARPNDPKTSHRNTNRGNVQPENPESSRMNTDVRKTRPGDQGFT
uniref:Uncharacterized protein n=1 Tax=Cannabis sativa TaxID=3483 RepID=A0A803PPW7_CANSA